MSGTALIRRGQELRVRKSVSLMENREYGFFRWYTQLKRIQRFGQLFPGVFPGVLCYGRAEDVAYFEMEYISGSLSGYEFLAGDPPTEQVDQFFAAVAVSMDRLHSLRRPSCREALELYLFEEVERPLSVCAQDPAFRDFAEHTSIVLNGHEVPGIAHKLSQVYETGRRFFSGADECYTHGNLTLENTLWVPSSGQVWFVDPYEENVLDTVHNEYSQLLQSCHSYYEQCNGREAVVSGNTVDLNIERVAAIDRFNELLHGLMRQRMTPQDIVIVRLYEVSQFTRMLPFKLAVARDKMVFFYAWASALFDRLCKDIDQDML